MLTQSRRDSAGPGTGSEFTGDRTSVGFDPSPNTVAGNSTFTFLSPPTRHGSGFELFGIPLTGVR